MHELLGLDGIIVSNFKKGTKKGTEKGTEKGPKRGPKKGLKKLMLLNCGPELQSERPATGRGHNRPFH